MANLCQEGQGGRFQQVVNPNRQHLGFLIIMDQESEVCPERPFSSQHKANLICLTLRPVIGKCELSVAERPWVEAGSRNLFLDLSLP